jgi:hypothetical protein
VVALSKTQEIHMPIAYLDVPQGLPIEEKKKLVRSITKLWTKHIRFRPIIGSS